MKTLLNNLLQKRHYKKSVDRLKTLEKQLTTPQGRFAIPFVYKGKGHFKSLKCMQNQSELQQLYKYIFDLQPKFFLEIGTAKGGALYLWLQASARNCVAISVDLPDGEFGGGYHTARIPFYQAFVREHQKLHLVRANSHEINTLHDVVKILQGNKLDFLFIDGDHTYEGVKQDFELYHNLVRKGGIIGFHDILPRQDLPEIQVSKFWKEIQQKYPNQTEEIIGPEGGERRIGCGILHVK